MTQEETIKKIENEISILVTKTQIMSKELENKGVEYGDKVWFDLDDYYFNNALYIIKRNIPKNLWYKFDMYLTGKYTYNNDLANYFRKLSRLL